MEISKSLLLASLVLMAVACQNNVEDAIPTPTPGQDVNFGGQLEETTGTRTIYGDEVSAGNSYSFPILWLKSDKVFIASPQCRENFNKGTFGLPADADHRNFAGSFIKESGAVQWGDAASADFYAIYPQRDGAYEVEPTSDYSATNATFQLNMPESQTCIVEATSGSPKMATADMNACFMYAKHTGVLNGTAMVDLAFKPLSTAIRFTLRGPQDQNQTVAVSRIRLIGPSGAALSGKFNVNLNGTTPVVTAVPGATSNIVTIYAQYESDAYLQLSTDQSIELNAFIIPVDGLEINGNWKLEITLSTGKVLTKTLNNSKTTDATLLAGKIHRLGNMPYMPSVALDPSKWMEFMPRNVFLSEISLPGSWNSLNKDFQTMASGDNTQQISENTIAAQYAAGCRAFHLDTRYRRISSISTNFTNLGVANGGENADVVIGGGKKVMKENACPLFSEALGYITSNVKESEYMVVVCTFAHNSYEGADWRQKVSDACTSNGYVYDASKITESTTIGDVLGKVIVIVATEEEISASDYPGSKCLFVKLPNTRSSAMYPTTAGYFDAQPIYKGGKASSGITLNCTQAQISSNSTSAIQTSDRGYAPTMDQRQTVGSNILTWAKTNYSAATGYAHNQWMYQGLGGYKVTNKSANAESGSYQTVANEMGAWISGKIGEMSPTGATRYHPVGILLMNFVDTNTTSKTAVNDILQLNNKFRKKNDSSKPEWPTGSRILSSAPGYSSGMYDNNNNAISDN